METNYLELREMAHKTRREAERRRDEFVAKAEQMDGYLHVLDTMEKLMAENERLREENKGLREENKGLREENERLREENEGLQRQLAEERRQRAELEMKLTELNKLTAGVAKKASEEVLLKTIQTYVNKSKQKRPEKRVAAKEWALEMVLANKLNVPEELAEAIEHLDDEQSEPKTVTVNGNYNDIHDNTTVNQK